MKTSEQQVTLTYIGPPNSDFGFKLAGINSQECENGEETVLFLRSLAENTLSSIVFIDESLVPNVLSEIEDIAAKSDIAVVLLPNPTNPKHLAATKMNNLMTQAVGSDILSNSN